MESFYIIRFGVLLVATNIYWAFVAHFVINSHSLSQTQSRMSAEIMNSSSEIFLLYFDRMELSKKKKICKFHVHVCRVIYSFILAIHKPYLNPVKLLENDYINHTNTDKTIFFFKCKTHTTTTALNRWLIHKVQFTAR